MAVVVRGLLATIAGGVLCAAQAGAQTSTGIIAGTVIDSASQQPLSNVTVRLDGTTRGTLSRVDGGYTLGAVAPGTYTLRASRIGYGSRTATVTVTAGQTATARLVLPAAAASLSAVVTIGYGTQRREAVTGAVATVRAEEANVGVIPNANSLLTARVAGVNVTANNGEPGGGVQVRIRGGTSLTASNEPLYVVDGVPLQQDQSTVSGGTSLNGVGGSLPRSPLNSISPDDIASITVLKDASATAIYGSRGANGVVLIETKRGQSGNSQLDYEVYVGAASRARSLDFLTADQFRSFVNQQISAGNIGADARQNLGSANTNWEDAISRTAILQNHNLAFSGGSQSTQYRASLNYFDQPGVVIQNGLQRYQGRVNGQSQGLQGKLQLGLNLTASRVQNRYLAFENTGGFEGGVFTNTAYFNPTQPIRVANGGYFEIAPGSQSIRNPVALAEQIRDVGPENRILGNVTASYALPFDLTSRTLAGVDYTNSTRQTYFPLASPAGASVNGSAAQRQQNNQNLTFQQTLTWAPSLGQANELEVLGGYEYTRVQNDGFGAIMQGFVTDAFGFNNLGAGSQAASPVPYSFYQLSNLASFFGRANYTFRNRYNLQVSVRQDGSSRLSTGNQWATFPGVSASWRISEESFGRSLPFSNLALRASFGRNGSQAVRPYGTQLLFRADNGARYPFGTGVTTGLVAAQVQNPNLKWETTDQVNVGFDYGFKNNRFTGLVDYYVKTTNDLILDVAVAQPAVVSTQLANVGSIRNRGLEASLDAQVFRRQGRSLDAGLILTVERNEVLNLGGQPFILTGGVSGQGQSGQNAQRLIPGQPVGTFFGRTSLGIENGREVFACTTGTGCTNGRTNDAGVASQGVIGNANPDFSVGFRSNGTWGKFDVSWLWRGEFGRDVFNNTALVYGDKNNAANARNFLRSGLTDGLNFGQPSVFSSRFVQDGSFVRLQNARVGYTFALPGRFGGGRTTNVYVAGDNLLLFTPYKGYDPEVFVASGLASRGIDYLAYPRARTFTTGARIQF